MSKFLFYPETRKRFIKILHEKYLDLQSQNGVDDDTTAPENLLWLLENMDEVKKGESEREHCARAGRWIGYVNGILEKTDLIKNEEVRMLIRSDIRNNVIQEEEK